MLLCSIRHFPQIRWSFIAAGKFYIYSILIWGSIQSDTLYNNYNVHYLHDL